MPQNLLSAERVGSSLGTFVINLIESVIIVVLILMIAMGFKSGLIIGISLVITVFGSFLFLYSAGGTMQRVSLAAFVLAMGMLVDNAIVIIDGILVDLKAGKNRMEAMTAIGRQTAMPLLGATLIAIIAFLPIYMSPDTAGVYTRDLFIVLAVSLLLSWILALIHVPLMADRRLHPAIDTDSTGKASIQKGKNLCHPPFGTAVRSGPPVEFCICHDRSVAAFRFRLPIYASGLFPRHGLRPALYGIQTSGRE